MRPCPNCSSPPSSHSVDATGGDLICTNCGAVLDERLRDAGPEWRDYSSQAGGRGDDDPGAVARRARCGDAYGRRELDDVRARLRRTHNMIEHMIERDRMDRMAEAALERRARTAMRDRGEEAYDGGWEVEGRGNDVIDDEIYDRGGGDKSRTKKRKAWTDRGEGKDEAAYVSTHVNDDDGRWSLVDSVLLHGTSDQIRRIVPCPSPGGWTEDALESERADLRFRLCISPSSSRRGVRGGGGAGGGGGGEVVSRKSTIQSLVRLYVAYDILERAARVLDLLDGTSSSSSFSSNGNNKGAAFRLAVSWLLTYALRNDGLRVRGISSSIQGGLGYVDGGGVSLSLSLFGHGHRRLEETETLASSSQLSSSLASEFHRLRQCAALGSALLYLSAKRAGVGRTLSEVCLAFGTYTVIVPNGDSNNHSGVVGEPLVRPKHCSRAMHELRVALPEEVSPPPPPISAPTPSVSSADSPMSNIGDDETTPREITPPHDGSAHGSTTTSIFESASSSSSSLFGDECIPEKCVSGGVGHVPDDAATMANEASLADLTTRMANALGLPSCAVSAASAVAVQCARDARASSSAPSVGHRRVEKAHIRPIRKKGRGWHGCTDRPGKNDHAPDDVIAIASILLVCTAGGTMQRLARQATGDAASSSTSPALGGTEYSMPHRLDDLADDLFMSEFHHSCPSTTDDVKVEETRSNNHSKKDQLGTPPPWKAWNDQPSWHRDICQMERCAVIPRRAIISYYSNTVYPRRSYFLEIAGKSVAGDGVAKMTTVLLLRSILAAVPLMSLRNL
ncbi:hypothetical protein ACHAXA_001404 [Cyclostephanos tholiformis]|uniref:General transcription factor TFIIB n=1 Tax=Cyclostephanos tholiformis TaxID=382380 RepID=A0ABD3R6J8_9STRA